MNKIKKLAVLLSLGALLPVAALSAKSLEQSYLETCRKGSEVPVPIAVVSPIVSPEHAGATVEVAFVVDATGKPTGLSVKSGTDEALASAVIEAVEQWRFTPAHVDGTPVATKVVLPVRVIDGTLAGARYAMK